MADEEEKKKKETQFLQYAAKGDYNSCSFSLLHKDDEERNPFKIDYVNLKDENGNTALMLAIKNKKDNESGNKTYFRNALIELLIDKGSDLNATNNDGQTALDMATSNKLLSDMLKHKLILDSLERGEFEVKEDGMVSIEESKKKLREIEKELKINEKYKDEIEGEYLKKIKSFIKTYILLKGGKKSKTKYKNKRSQKTKSRNFRKTRHRSRV
jgi:ankyrin repeat protein